jgi:hypothetical protein
MGYIRLNSAGSEFRHSTVQKGTPKASPTAPPIPIPTSVLNVSSSSSIPAWHNHP